MHPLIMISGPSGSGKTTIVREFVKAGLCHEAVSCTTRSPRSGEVEGVSYYFLTQGQFDDLVAQDGLYENVVFNGNHYGISKREIDSKVLDKPTFLVIEPFGVSQIKAVYRGPVITIYLRVPFDTCLGRMIRRGDDPDKAIKRNDHDEKYFVESAKTIKWDVVITNHEFGETVRSVTDIVGPFVCRGATGRCYRIGGDIQHDQKGVCPECGGFHLPPGIGLD